MNLATPALVERHINPLVFYIPRLIQYNICKVDKYSIFIMRFRYNIIIDLKFFKLNLKTPLFNLRRKLKRKFYIAVKMTKSLTLLNVNL